MGLHVFVDEVKERGYLVTAAALLSGELAPARRIVASLVMPRQRRLHFNKESDGRRKQIIDALLEIAPQVTIYDAVNQPRQRQRDACLRLLVADAAAVHVDKLVLERDDSVVEADRRLLFAEVRRLGYSSLHYVHLRGHEEPLLAIPDAVAWCWNRGGHWRRRVEPLAVEVRRAP